MQDFNRELVEICAKYGLHFDCPVDYCKLFLDKFQEVWNAVPDDEPIALYGFGKGAYIISKRIKFDKKNVVCIVDNNLDFVLHDDEIPIISIKDAGKYDFKKIFLTGFGGRQEMKQDVFKLGKDIEIIDIYDLLKEEGHVYTSPFFGTASGKKYYFDIEQSRFAYKNSTSREELEKNLKLLIRDYIECRDFVCAFIYIEEYKKHEFSDSSCFAELRSELENLIFEIKKTIQMKQNRNVFVFVLDAFSLDMSKRIPFIKELSEQSLYFTNAYAPSFHTRASTLMFLTGKHYLKDGLYKYNAGEYVQQRLKFEKEHSDFLMQMQSNGVKVKHISSSVAFHYLQDLKMAEGYDHTASDMQPRLYWNMLTEAAYEDLSCIYIVHSSYETHHPYHSGNPDTPLLTANEIIHQYKHREDASMDFIKHMHSQRADALKYAGEQLEFYVNLIDTDKDSVIVTADHGEWYMFAKELGVTLTEDMWRVPFIICSKQVTPGVNKNIFHSIHMPDILRQLILGDNELIIPKTDYVRLEIEPSYGNRMKNDKNFKENMIEHTGEIHILTEHERYLFRLSGQEEYYHSPNGFYYDLSIWSNGQNNMIDDEQFKERIDYFRSQICIDTRDVWRYLFDKYPSLSEVYEDKAEEFMNENKNPTARSN